jgi:hypothetical protein
MIEEFTELAGMKNKDREEEREKTKRGKGTMQGNRQEARGNSKYRKGTKARRHKARQEAIVKALSVERPA